MKRRFTSLGAFLPAAFFVLVATTHAQSSPAVIKASGPLAYDLSKEITLNGTVSSVLAKPSAGMLLGSHCLLRTPSGTVDLSLGRFALEGKNALPVAPGQQISAAGVMKTINNQPVFLARIVSIDGRAYAIRNQRGTALSPEARQRLSQSSGQKGELP